MSEAHYQRYRAPREDGSSLVEPGWQEILRQVARRRQEALTVESAAESRATRRQLLDLAHGFTSAFCAVPALPEEAAHRPLIMSGHQPELFHPGVWFKNFALDAIAKATGGIGVHLLIDSDLCRRPSIRAPRGPVETPRVESVAFDGAAAELPFEQRGVVDHRRVQTFAARVAETVDGLIENPLAAAMSTDLAEAARATGNLGQTLSRARRIVEERWGSTTLELPVSAVCDTDAFRAFACRLIEDPPRLHDAYNGALNAYRRAHRLRTRAQPLPDLKRDDGWWEAPLWVWTDENPVRRPLFVRVGPRQGMQLTDRSGAVWSTGETTANAVESLAELRQQGVKIRGRALVTTLYTRSALGDLFLHGIGGAKYDQVTDEFARRLFGSAPPPHATLSATLRLPIPHERVEPTADIRLRQRLRELRYHPERFVAPTTAAAEQKIANKQAAVAIRVGSGSNLERHKRIEHANAELQLLAEPVRQEVLAQQESLATRQQAATVLGGREYAFCLFPKAHLREQMYQLTAGVANASPG